MMDAPNNLRDTSLQDRALEERGFWSRNRSISILGAVVAAVLIGFISAVERYSGLDSSVDRSRLTIATVERGSLVRDVAADGQVVATVSPMLYATSAGTVTLKVHSGDSVHKGQPLGVIDSPDLTARLAQEQQTLQSLQTDWERARLDAARMLAQVRATSKQAEVDNNTAQRELDRSQKAFELGSYSELQVMRAKDTLEKTQFALELARDNLDAQPKQNRFDVSSRKALLDRQALFVKQLHREVDALIVRSPVDGEVGQVEVADRANVAKDAPLLTVVDLSALAVEIKVPENLALDLRPGISADLEAGGQHWQGTVSGVSPEVVNGQVTARVRFSGQKPAQLRQNQRVAVRILLERRDNVLVVDRGSFVDQEGGAFAYVVHGNVAEKRAIHLGVASISKVEVLSGLAAGDQVIVSGTDALNGSERVILSH